MQRTARLAVMRIPVPRVAHSVQHHVAQLDVVLTLLVYSLHLDLPVLLWWLLALRLVLIPH